MKNLLSLVLAAGLLVLLTSGPWATVASGQEAEGPKKDAPTTEDPAKAPAGNQQQQPLWMTLMPFVFILFMLYLIFIRPAQRQERERQIILSSVKKNDKVLLSSGIYGTIIAIAEKEDELTVKVDDNTRLKVVKGSIARNLTGEETLRAAKAAAAAGQPVKADDKAAVTAAALKADQGVKGK